MRQYIGHKMRFFVQGLPSPITGTMISDDASFIYLKGDKEIVRIVKGKICAFAPMDFEPADYVPFHVLYCSNAGIGCEGVQFIKDGTGFNQMDLEIFMSKCPCKSADCDRGTKGELRSVSGTYLKKIFNGMMFGDYPEKKGVSNGVKRTGKETGSGKGKG